MTPEAIAPDDPARPAIDAPLVRTFARILIVEMLVIGGLYWMSRYFS